MAKKSFEIPLAQAEKKNMRMIEVITNIKRKLVFDVSLLCCLRLDEVRNLKWQNIDFDSGIIHVKTVKGKRKAINLAIV